MEFANLGRSTILRSSLYSLRVARDCKKCRSNQRFQDDHGRFDKSEISLAGSPGGELSIRGSHSSIAPGVPTMVLSTHSD